jgi:hypothetical protein
MKNRLAWLTFLGALLAVAGLPIASALAPEPEPEPGWEQSAVRPHRLEIPQRGAYSGAFIELGEREDNVTLEGIERFDGLVRQRQAILAFSNDWGNGSFPERQLRIVAAYGAVPLIYWSPWDRFARNTAPKGERRFALEDILAGQWNGYIDSWAGRARDYGAPLLVSWGLEMNGNWFPWSGSFHGGGAPVPGCQDCFAGPEKFKQAYRFVVDRVRAKGAVNVQWVWHSNNASIPEEPWNAIGHYYPGPGYVDWLALSAYGTQFLNEGWISVDKALSASYRELCGLDASKPLMLAEWGVAELPKMGKKGLWVSDFFARLPRDYPRIRAAVVWHERWQNGDRSISNLRVSSSPEALDAYRRGVASPYWLARPIYRP